MAKNDNLKDFLTDVADAIREKKGTTEPINPQDFSSEIASIESGVGSMSPASKNDVTFYDYEGTILYSYTKEEFLSLNEMPSLPTREGLTCQGWNYTMEDAVAYVSKYGVLDVGATYITDDGKTRLYIRIADKGRMNVPLYFSQTVANGVNIDWGDGSDVQTLSGKGNVNTSHVYANIGDYCISLDIVDGCVFNFGDSYYSVIRGNGYMSVLKKIEIGKNVISIGNYAFSGCRSLSSITLPESVTSIGTYVFRYCYNLLSVTIPKNTSNIGRNSFENCCSLVSCIIPKNTTKMGSYVFCRCYSLSSITLPESVTSINYAMFQDCENLSLIIIPKGVTVIDSEVFYYCYALTSITFPENIKEINNYAFFYCSGIAYFDFSQLLQIPTLVNTNAFNGISSDCKIVVPDSLYDSWIAETNWSTYKSKIVKASEFNV